MNNTTLHVGQYLQTPHGVGRIIGFERFYKDGFSAPMASEWRGEERVLLNLLPGHTWTPGIKVYALFARQVTIEALNPSSVPCISTDFYAWLDVHHTKGWNRMKDKQAYLEARGFVIGQDRLTRETIDVLNSIHHVHFMNNHTAPNAFKPEKQS